jgi:hypothetical protein
VSATSCMYVQGSYSSCIMHGILTEVVTTSTHDSCRSGAAAARRDREKIKKYAESPAKDFDLAPLTSESYGTLGKPAEELLARLARAAVENKRADSEETFLRWAYTLLSVSICKGNAEPYRPYRDYWEAKGSNKL